jgi:hypothetical protein
MYIVGYVIMLYQLQHLFIYLFSIEWCVGSYVW